MMRRLLTCTVVGVLWLVAAVPAWGDGLFGFREGGLTAAALNANGTPDTQAGSHPYELTVKVAVNEQPETGGAQTGDEEAAGGDVKDIEVALPPGLVGDPSATPQCPESTFHNKLEGLFANACPDDSQIGVAHLEFGEIKAWLDVYNLVPPRGTPAEFGFTLLGVPVVLVPHVRTGGDDGVSVTFTSIPQGFSLTAGTMTLWGVPADAGHDAWRGECLGQQTGPTGGSCPVSVPAKPFLSLPTSCTGPLRFGARIDSYEAPGVYREAEAAMPGMTGCDRLSFTPSIVAEPEPAQAESPSGLSVEIQVPQTYENPGGLATANLRDTTVTLPAGVTVNPAAADGLLGCGEEQFGLHDAAEVACPNASKVGQVEVTTPLLEHPLKGGVYLAQQGNLPGNGSNPFGSLIALYLEIRDPYAGVLVKLAGEVKADPMTGQLVTSFLENPQLPFDSLRLSFFAGPRAALVNPPLCGAYTTSAQMTPWSGGAPASPTWEFQIDTGPGGSACTASQAFSPSLVAGTTSNQAAGFTPFSLTFDRSDGEQNMSRIQVTMPPGLLGDLSDVALCGEPQAAQGTCGPQSLIGTTTVAVGAGSSPFYVTGKVYLTGSYEGAPYGLSFVVPAVAGPYDLGTVVVRAAVDVNPETVALTVTSEPLPQILQGVPLHIRAVNVMLDRERFIFNPTSCDPAQITANMSSNLGASSLLTTRFQATNCQALAFKPRFQALTSGHTSRKDGASLEVKLSYPQGSLGKQANIARAKVELPKALPSRLSTLQKACPADTFQADPAGCPAASVVGYAKASTPILPVGLSGPVYFVSHGGEAFPSLVIVLQGYGVRVDLTGTTFIGKKGITSTTLKSVPDVPVHTFELYLPEGPDSALAANKNLCEAAKHRHRLVMPTEFVSQDNMTIHQHTPIAVTGCKQPGATTARRRKTRRAKDAKPVRGETKQAHEVQRSSHS